MMDDDRVILSPAQSREIAQHIRSHFLAFAPLIEEKVAKDVSRWSQVIPMLLEFGVGAPTKFVYHFKRRWKDVRWPWLVVVGVAMQAAIDYLIVMGKVFRGAFLKRNVTLLPKEDIAGMYER